MKYLIIFAAEYLIVLIVLFASVNFLKLEKQKKKEMFVFATIALPIIFIFSRLASKLYFNPRPFIVENFIPLVFHSNDNGFPSDHTLLATAVAAVTYFFNKKIGIILGLLAILVGLARVIAGVHHLVDIFGSIAIVILVSVLTHKYLFKFVLQKLSK